MDKYIKLDDVMEALLHEQYGYLCEDAIRAIHAADVRPVVRAINKSKSGFLCSACSFGDFGGFNGYKPNFCPNCGAYVREKADEII